jgi:hypothetical protein
MTLDEEANIYRRVFGVEGERNPAQEHVWSVVWERIMRSSNLENKSPETSRDFCLKVYKTTTRKHKDEQ